jgi:hypothetical protein
MPVTQSRKAEKARLCREMTGMLMMVPRFSCKGSSDDGHDVRNTGVPRRLTAHAVGLSNFKGPPAFRFVARLTIALLPASPPSSTHRCISRLKSYTLTFPTEYRHHESATTFAGSPIQEWVRVGAHHQSRHSGIVRLRIPTADMRLMRVGWRTLPRHQVQAIVYGIAQGKLALYSIVSMLPH